MTTEQKQGNREHKDSVFKLLFSEPEILRELYSAIEGVDLPPDIPIDINTISGVLVKGIRNDISFIIDKRLVLLTEHQSTINPNMPLRVFRYFGKVLNKIVNYDKAFNRQLIKIPRPKFIVLYNGKSPFPEHVTLKLSDAFMDTEGLTGENDQVSLELTVDVYNINNGQNKEIQRKCDTLNEYGIFIEKIREYESTGLSLDEALKCAVKYCIENNILRDFLMKHGSEVIAMLVEEYTTEDFLKAMVEEALEEAREEGLEKGREEGREEGQNGVLELMDQGWSSEKIKAYLNEKSGSRG